MNVLSAPFLFTLPSQIEAFACFSTFIEQSCPLYVQPTLVGVHKGLKVSYESSSYQGQAELFSSWINASRLWILSFSTTYGAKTYRLSYTPSRVSSLASDLGQA